MTTKPSIGLSGYFMSNAADELAESVKAAEDAGYKRAFLNDAHTLWQDVYVHMSRVLDRTERIPISSGVTNMVTRHFSVTASGHATLGQLHPGRVILGLGRGDASVHTMGIRPMKVAEFARQAEMVRKLFRGEEVEAVEGRTFKIAWIEDCDVKIMIGATGPRNLRVAGSIADIVQVEVGVHPAAVQWAIDQIHDGAKSAGRDPSEIEISLVCAMWVDDDLSVAREKCRWAAASAANHIEEVMGHPGHGMPDELTRVVERRREMKVVHDYDSHLDNESDDTSFLTDEMIDDFGIAGDPDRCLEKLQKLAELGVSEVASGFLNGELDQINRVGKDLIPRLGAN